MIITYGLGGLTLITMGLGSGIFLQEIPFVYEEIGEVTFVDKPGEVEKDRVDFKNDTPEIRFRKDNLKISMKGK